MEMSEGNPFLSVAQQEDKKEASFSRARELMEDLKQKRESFWNEKSGPGFLEKENSTNKNGGDISVASSAHVQERMQESLNRLRERLASIKGESITSSSSDVLNKESRVVDDRSTAETISLTRVTSSGGGTTSGDGNSTLLTTSLESHEEGTLPVAAAFGFVVNVPTSMNAKPPTLEDIAEALREFSEMESEDDESDDESEGTSEGITQEEVALEPPVPSINPAVDEYLKNRLNSDDIKETSLDDSSNGDDAYAPSLPTVTHTTFDENVIPKNPFEDSCSLLDKNIPKLVESFESKEEDIDDNLSMDDFGESEECLQHNAFGKGTSSSITGRSTMTMSTLGSKSVNDYIVGSKTQSYSSKIPFFKRKEMDRKKQQGAPAPRRNRVASIVEQFQGNASSSAPPLSSVLPNARIKDKETRRELLVALRADIASNKKFKFIPFPFVPASFQRNKENDGEDDVNISSESSYSPSVHDSDTSGWLSSGESTDAGALFRDLSMSSTFDASLSPKRTLPRNILKTSSSEDRSEDGLLYSQEKEKKLFLSEDEADQHAGGELGGSYFLALMRGMSEDTPICVTTVPLKDAPKAIKSLQCTSYGSLYEVAQRSGADIPVMPLVVKKRIVKKKRIVRRKVPRSKVETDAVASCLGGMYMVCLQSGWTLEKLRSRESYTVKARLTGRQVKGSIDVLPERYTDHECGAMGGSLYLFTESVGATYTASGSMLYMAERSGLGSEQDWVVS